MSRNPQYAANYRQQVQKYFNKGYAEPVSKDDNEDSSRPVWYLPHFGVVNPNKPNKIRIVLDAAATVASLSLNTALLKGPGQGPEQAQPLPSLQISPRYHSSSCLHKGNV